MKIRHEMQEHRYLIALPFPWETARENDEQKRYFRRTKSFQHSKNMHNKILFLRTLLFRYSSVFQQTRSKIIFARAESQWTQTSTCFKCTFLTQVANSSLFFIYVMHCKTWVQNQKTLTLFYQGGVKNWLSLSLTSYRGTSKNYWAYPRFKTLDPLWFSTR